VPDIDELFARFEAEATGTFHQPPVPDLRARARRRWWRRAGLAGALAVAVAVPVGALNLADREPAPVVVTDPVERRVELPGVPGPYQIMFVEDARHAWAFGEECLDGTDECRRALATTTDGGVTWRPSTLPGNLRVARVLDLYPVDARTLVIGIDGVLMYLTTDTGATWTSHVADDLPPAAQRAWTTPIGSRWTVRCPGLFGFEDGVNGFECGRRQLVRIGAGPVAPQPTLAGALMRVVEGRDGRLWLISWHPVEGDLRTRVAVSTDQAATWTELPSVPALADLTVSPDGHDVWLVAGSPGRLWQVDGGRLVERTGLPGQVDSHDAVAAGGGVLAVGSENVGGGFWRDGSFTPLPGLGPASPDVLPDGTVVFSYGNGARLVGTGTGTDRSWVRIS